MNRSWTNYLPPFLRYRLEGRHYLQNLISNAGWLLLDNVLRMVIGLLVGVWVARYLGPEQFGLLNYAIAFVMMFSSIATLGLDGIVIRDIVSEPSRKEALLGTALVLKITGGIATFLVTMLAVFLLRPQDNMSHLLVAITAAGTIFQAFDAIDFWFQSQVQSKYTVYAKNCAYISISLVKVGLIMLKAPLIAFACAGLAETIIVAAGLITVYRKNGQSIKMWCADAALARRLLHDSWPLIFSGTFVLINMTVDKIMLGDLASNAEVGFFTAAARLSEVWYCIPMIVGGSVMPALVMEKADNESNYLVRLQQTYNLMSICALSLALPITFLSPKLIALLYGTGYSAAAHMLSVHIWTGLFVYHVSIRTRSLMVEGKQRFIAVMSFFTMVFNVVFNFFLIPPYGGVGASYASLFSWVLCALLVPYFSKQTSESVSMFFRSLYFWVPVKR